MLRKLWSGLKRALLALLLALIAYVGYAHWAWRDIPVAQLEPRYGDDDLRIANIDGVPIRYRLSGSDARPVLVLIHSHYLDMTLWDAWLPQLTPHYRVLRYDLSGHGLTGPDASGVYTVARDVALLDGLLNKLQIGDVTVVGSSLGGNIAFTFAAQQAQRVRALVLINSGGLKRANSRSRGEIPSWADHLMPLVPPAALHAFLRWMVADKSAITPGEQQRFVEMWRREGNRAAELARLRQFEPGDPDALLARITAPALILWGEQNPQLPVALATQFAEKLSASPYVERKTYAGAGHILPIERAEQSVTDTLAFLRNHDRAFQP